MADDLFAEVKGEGATLDIDKAFERLEQGEEPSESSTEKIEEKTPDSSKDSGKWAQIRKEAATARREAEAAKAEIEALKNQSKETSLPEWWKKQYGDTPESKERYQLVTSKDGELDWIKQSVLSEVEQRQQTETQTVKAGEEYVDTQLQEMTDEGLKFERNGLLKFMVDFQKEFGAGSLLDAEGNYDFRKSLALMERFEPEEEKENVNKTLASQASKSKVNSPSTSKIPVISRRDLRRGWRDAGL
jgi:stringent starvation protein B